MIPTINFLAPSLHPNTLTDVSVPVPSSSSGHLDPVVRHLAIKHGDRLPVGSIKQIVKPSNDTILVADDGFRLSTLKISTDEPAPPEVVQQYIAKSKAGSVWAGMVSTGAGTVAVLSSGQASYHPTSALSSDNASDASTSVQTASLPSNLLCLASCSKGNSTFALAGKEVDVSVFDVERTFGAAAAAGAEGGDVEMVSGKNAKREKETMLPGETWRAKNLPNDSLSLRPPIHHLALTYLTDSDVLLASGTKSGHVRRYDTRQRKPVSNWKIAREGGINTVCPVGEHELFFSDRSGLLGSLDLRTGKLLYTLPSTATPHHLLSLPSQPTSGSSRAASGTPIGLASISSDATMRINSITPPPSTDAGGAKGNWRNGAKADVVSSVRGVGIGSFVCTGWGEMAEPEKVKPADGEEGASGDEDEDSDDEEGEGEDVWEGMEEVGGDEDDDDEDADSDEEETQAKPAKKHKKRR